MALWPDQGEHVILVSVLADQCRGQPQPTRGLDVGGGPEHGCRQHVHLVVDHQAPVVLAEELEVHERVGLAPPPGEDLVGGDGDGTHFLHGARVLADLVLAELGLGEQFAAPLAYRRVVGREDQGLPADARHGPQTHHGLAGPAGQHHHPAAPLGATVAVEGLHRRVLVVAQAKRRPIGQDRAQGHRERTAVHIARQVLHRPAQLDQGPLDLTALGDGDPQPLRQALTHQVARQCAVLDLLQQQLIVRLQQQVALGAGREPQAAVAGVQVHQIP